jgi:cytochrome c-type biogenesis protein CcmH
VTLFIIIAVIMTLIAVVFLLVPLKKRHAPAALMEHANLDVLRSQMAELENDFQTGVIGEKEYQEARNELDRRTLEETDNVQPAAAAPETAPVARSKKIIWSAIAFFAIICVGGVLYTIIGTPQVFTPQMAQSQDTPHTMSPQDMDMMLNEFAARMKNEPDNLNGWFMLARSYAQTGKLKEAADAYEHLISRLPNDAVILSDYADLVGAMQDGDLSGKPMELIERALKADPKNWKALALAGTHAFNVGDFNKAVEYWSTIKSNLPPDADPAMIEMLDQNINEAKSRAMQK